MEYDVFISYSRKDSQQVKSLIDRLRRDIPGLKIWYDIEGIETAEEFSEKIISAIDKSKTIIYAFSDNSLASNYCKKEVMYAKNTGKKVIPYLLPGIELKGWLLFEFGFLNCIHASKADEVGRMINDLKKWSGKSQASVQNPQNSNNTNRISSLEFDPTTGEFRQKSKTIISFINGHEYVDLGLPSGLKWATCNIGASSPEQYGSYFAFGETRTKSSYNSGNSETYGKDTEWLRSNGFLGGDGNLTLSHDAASRNWGGTWRMPTMKERDELINNTTSEWTNLKGVKGVLIKSKRNGKSIFLPAAGYYEGDFLGLNGSNGEYWTSTCFEINPKQAFYLDCRSDGIWKARSFSSNGRTIRPVSE